MQQIDCEFLLAFFKKPVGTCDKMTPFWKCEKTEESSEL